MLFLVNLLIKLLNSCKIDKIFINYINISDFRFSKSEAQFTTVSAFGTIKSGYPAAQSAPKPMFDSTIDLKLDIPEPVSPAAEKLKMRFSYPLAGTIHYTSEFGLRFHPLLKQLKLHAGVDIKACYEPVFSIADGIIKTVAWGEREGIYIIITHGDFESVYAHLSKVYEQSGQFINVAEQIGVSGNSGMSNAAHLHFGMKYKGRFFNPRIFLDYIEKLISKGN